MKGGDTLDDKTVDRWLTFGTILAGIVSAVLTEIKNRRQIDRKVEAQLKLTDKE